MRGQSRIQTSVVAEKVCQLKHISSVAARMFSLPDNFRRLVENKSSYCRACYNNGVFAAANKPIIGPPVFIFPGSCPVNPRLLSRG